MKKTDLGYLISMTDNNKEVIIEMIDIFIDQVVEFGNEMEDYYREKNFMALGQLAHKAKSSVAIMGMDSLSKKLKKLEILINEGRNPGDYRAIINDFKLECLEGIKELELYKSNL